jgi:hypothetical protein
MYRINFKFISRPLRIKGVSIKRVNIFSLNKKGCDSMKHICIETRRRRTLLNIRSIRDGKPIGKKGRCSLKPQFQRSNEK